MRFEREPWVKLYRREQGAFAQLPLYVRAIAAELLKFCDDDGRIFVGRVEPWAAIAKVCGADTSDRRLLKQHIPILLSDGYLVTDGDYIVVRNLRRAQERRKATQTAPESAGASASGERVEHEPSASGERVVNESSANENEPCTTSDASTRDDSDRSLTGARAHSDPKRYDPKRYESLQPPAAELAPGGHVGPTGQQPLLVTDRAGTAKPAKPRGKPAGDSKAKHGAAYGMVVDCYFAEFRRARGVDPAFAGAEGASVNRLLDLLCGKSDRACEAIRCAFADGWWAAHNGSIKDIASDPNKYLGRPATAPHRHVVVKQEPAKAGEHGWADELEEEAR